MKGPRKICLVKMYNELRKKLVQSHSHPISTIDSHIERSNRGHANIESLPHGQRSLEFVPSPSSSRNRPTSRDHPP